MNDLLVKTLRCVGCGGAVEKNAGSIQCGTCHTSYAVKNDRVFFTDVPNDYEGSGVTSTTDPSTWSAWRMKNYSFYKEHLAVLPQSAHVLDVGIGPGQFRDLTERFHLTAGVDFRAFEPVQVVADLTKPLPFKDEQFDAVVISNTLEHLPNTEDVLAEVYRVLKRGGVLLATIPFVMRLHQKPYDFNRYTNFKLAWLLDRARFRDIEVHGLSTPLDVYRTIQRQFYTYIVHNPLSRNRVLAAVLKFVARVLWRFERLKLTVFRFLYERAPISDDFTEGYGIKAYR